MEEDMMRSLSEDLSILKKLALNDTPIGVKFSFLNPEGFPPLGEEYNFSLCEMIRHAQKTGEAFYFSRHHKESCVGKIFLGMEEMEPFAEAGMIGERLNLFQEARANCNLYQYIYKMDRNTVNYVTFAPLDKLTFDPDVLLLNAPVEKAEIIMRATSFATGDVFNSMSAQVMGCTWFLVYPFRTGKVNFVVPAFIDGPSNKRLWPMSDFLISIPYPQLHNVISSLKEIEWDRFSETVEEHNAKFAREIGKLVEDTKNP
jgi:uncharacterized protein (DUF169 family)